MRYFIKYKPDGTPIKYQKREDNSNNYTMTGVSKETYYQSRYVDGYDDGEDFKSIAQLRFAELLNAQYPQETQFEILRELNVGYSERFNQYCIDVNEFAGVANDELTTLLAEVSSEIDSSIYLLDIDTDDTISVVDEADAMLAVILSGQGVVIPETELDNANEIIEKKARRKGFVSKPIPEAEYAPTQRYLKSERVTGSDGVVYTATKPTKGVNPVGDTTGTWESDVAIALWIDDPLDFYYWIGDIREYEGIIYECNTKHSKTALNNPTSQSGKKVWDVKQ